MDPLLLPPLAPSAPLSAPPLPANLEDVHIAQVATAPPPKNGPNHLNHPPYAEMIVSAIKSLNEKKGSSRKAIAKFIDSTYSNLPPSHSALLTHHLKRLKKNGIVVMIKHSYALPKSVPPPLLPCPSTGGPSTGGTATTSAAAAAGSGLLPKRGRGRPPKPKPIIGPDGSVSVSVLPMKKGPGRPPKSISKPMDRTGQRSRGRPRKGVSGSGPTGSGSVFGSLSVNIPIYPPEVTKFSAAGRPVGRPRRFNVDSSVVVGAVKPNRVSSGRPVGRPVRGGVVKPLSVSTGRPVGRPPKVGGIVKPKRVSSGRPVGRPPKVGGARGRPPKVGGVEKLVRVPTGRPVGRPRKGHLKERAVKLLEESLALGLNQDVPTMLRRETELYHIITGREYHAVAGDGSQGISEHAVAGDGSQGNCDKAAQ